MNQDKITELLKNYPYYRYAVRMYETDRPVALRATEYSDMPRGGGFGTRAPKLFGLADEDELDYDRYKKAVVHIEGALETLTDEEQSVIKLRWMDELSLDQIADRKSYSRSTIKRTHKRALAKLTICLRFVDIPYIEEITVA
ncbi:sigma-70 family RNA polymerase sigma factor [Paenibacillus lautus]|uniref:sigma-70 family RNA polymerase sigma factor n=1 Tax=Paenibacillus lautus TaxID=1401 RepID=UPI00384AC553